MDTDMQADEAVRSLAKMLYDLRALLQKYCQQNEDLKANEGFRMPLKRQAPKHIRPLQT